ncbi:MAG: DUF2029 domain-containing protein [Anaerolineales bacterium]|nr:DUF2029 domain-containing protein [Anaerolineales bacterium]
MSSPAVGSNADAAARPAARPGLRRLLAALVVVLFIAADTAAMYAIFTSRFPGLNDFYARWQPTRAWLMAGQNPYSAEATLGNQLGLMGRPARPGEDRLQFAYPFFSMLFFLLPALSASYAWASALWLALLQVALLALLGLSLAWSRWRPAPWLFGATMVFGIFWYHGARALILGQVAVLVAGLVAGALVCVRNRKEAWAGALLALTAAKPQMSFLIIPALWLWAAGAGRWRLLAWSAGTLAALVGGSFLLLPTWLPDWLAQIPIYAAFTVSAPPTAVIAEALFPAQARLWQAVVSGALLVYLAWAWRQAWGDSGARFERAALLTLVTTCLLAPRTATTDYLMMTPALFTLLGRAAHRHGAWLAAAVEIGLLAGLWALFFLTVQGDQEQAMMYLPLPILLWVFLASGRPARLATARVGAERGVR